MLSLYLQGATLILLPLIYTIGVSIAFWSVVTKPWYFSICCIASLYALYLTALYFAMPTMGGNFLERTENVPLGQQKPRPLLDFLDPYLLPMFVFSVLAIPTVWGLLKLFRKQ
jgi:hypothetical protein